MSAVVITPIDANTVTSFFTTALKSFRVSSSKLLPNSSLGSDNSILSNVLWPLNGVMRLVMLKRGLYVPHKSSFLLGFCFDVMPSVALDEASKTHRADGIKRSGLLMVYISLDKVRMTVSIMLLPGIKRLHMLSLKIKKFVRKTSPSPLTQYSWLSNGQEPCLVLTFDSSLLLWFLHAFWLLAFRRDDVTGFYQLT